MLSKCANPECSEQFRYLHQGKLFHLTPTPEIEMLDGEFSSSLYERFWLCDRCSKEMTLVWGGTGVRLAPLPAKPVALPALVPADQTGSYRPGKHAANAGSSRR
ncbi:MAG TPA: hypothetical protein VE377_10535 [Candidatus Dormibacteraeota bacterium]|nr:hypothetical protein [Candidatus Dormibacteraeota bacterium]